MKRFLLWGVALLILITLLAGGGAALLIKGVTTGTISRDWEPMAWLIDKGNQWQRSYADSGETECLITLAAMNVEYRVPAPLRGPQSCGIHAAIHLTRIGNATLKHAPPLSCKMALTLAHMEAEVIQPLARHHLGSEVREILHFGTYNCRGLRGVQAGLLSQHAYANALDLSGFKLANGQTVSVLFDWPAAEPGSTATGAKRARGAFLHALSEKSCDLFSVVLGPRSGKAHRDHLHLDQGPFNSCR
jgi:hypothetical protein